MSSRNATVKLERYLKNGILDTTKEVWSVSINGKKSKINNKPATENEAWKAYKQLLKKEPEGCINLNQKQKCTRHTTEPYSTATA